MLTLWPVVLALSAAPAQPIAVVDLDAPELMGLSSQVTRKVLETAQKSKLKVISPEMLRGKLDEKQYEMLKKCGGNTACAAQALTGLGAKSAVLGSLVRDEKNYLLKLWLIDLDTLKVVADVDRAILIAARRFPKDVDQAVPALLRGEREARGTLVLDCNLADAQLTLNGEFVGVPPLTLTLRPGKFQVKAERRKYLSVTRFVEVVANKKTTETFKLLLKPGEVADAQEVPDIVARKKEGPAARPLTLTAPTWIAAGVTLAAAGTGTLFGLSARSGEQRLLAGYNPDKGTYGGTRRQALAVQQDALVANVAWGVMGAAAAATVVFAVLDGTRSDGAVQVVPTVAPGAAGLLVGGRF